MKIIFTVIFLVISLLIGWGFYDYKNNKLLMWMFPVAELTSPFVNLSLNTAKPAAQYKSRLKIDYVGTYYFLVDIKSLGGDEAIITDASLEIKLECGQYAFNFNSVNLIDLNYQSFVVPRDYPRNCEGVLIVKIINEDKTLYSKYGDINLLLKRAFE